ncbi:putative halogenase [Suillus lakei]|nr:putative halogenase [Suillus lakei]
MACQTPPTSTQILVVGGGPSGSYAAAALAREGFEVTLLEAAKFPRYHIGESMLPSVRPFLGFIGAEQAVMDYGFKIKPGGAIKLNQSKREGYTDFVAHDPKNWSWNVIRSEFDDLLLRHASKCGALVIEETRVTEIQFEDASNSKPVSATWRNTGTGTEGRISFDYLVDASGRNGIMSTKYLKNRRFNPALNNVACWGYWDAEHTYMPGTKREDAIWNEALEDQSGWAWVIPLHDGTKSVGVVMDQEISNRKKKALRATAGDSNLETYYMQELRRAPGAIKLLGKGALRDAGKPGALKSASDYSYSASTYAGDHFRMSGDAAAFIDPFFSSGIHLAFTGGLSAALTIAASIRGLCSERDAQLWHTTKVDTSYKRFLLVVLGTYKQIRNQDMPVMSGVDEDNFDRAFELIRPVIQGTADVGRVLTEDEIEKTMDFCHDVLIPTEPEMDYASTTTRSDPVITSPDGSKLMTEWDLDHLVGDTGKDTQMVFDQLRAGQSIQTTSFGAEEHLGFKAVLERGKLGLVNL